MRKRKENEDTMQRKIYDLEHELERMKYQPRMLNIPTSRLSTPAEQYVIPPRSVVMMNIDLNMKNASLSIVLSFLIFPSGLQNP